MILSPGVGDKKLFLEEEELDVGEKHSPPPGGVGRPLLLGSLRGVCVCVRVSHSVVADSLLPHGR